MNDYPTKFMLSNSELRLLCSTENCTLPFVFFSFFLFLHSILRVDEQSENSYKGLGDFFVFFSKDFLLYRS